MSSQPISSAYIAYCNPPPSWNIQPSVIDSVIVVEETTHTPGGWGRLPGTPTPITPGGGWGSNPNPCDIMTTPTSPDGGWGSK